jgi:hypothetical protein
MNDSQENKVSAYLAVQKVLNEEGFKTLWRGIEEFVILVNVFEQNLAKILDLGQVQELNRTGVTILKKTRRNELVKATIRVVYGLSAYAVYRNDTELETVMDFTERDLNKLRDTTLLARCQMVYETAFPLRDLLGRVHLTEEDVEQVGRLRTEFLNVVSAPRIEISIRAAATQDLKTKIKETDRLLKNRIDKVVRGFEIKGAEYVDRYFIARKIVDN